MLPSVLADLLTFHAPLSTVHREQGGAVTLLTPGVNVLALNVTCLPADLSGVDLDAVLDWHERQGVPPLVATAGPLTLLPGREVARVEVGPLPPEPGNGEVLVEQVSRLHLGVWAEVLTQTHGTPEWSTSVGRHLAARLEEERSFVPLVAYRAEEAVGALLWQPRRPGGAAHLWGAADRAVRAALLSAAADLGGPLRVTLPVEESHPAAFGEGVHYTLLAR
ncbi:hypothetical protein LAJ19_10290 [Deinococcus taeanensis]|uniref:hypothetical protein n=1 Tax=Deinococcus taeanensis TaxID=2737050 RepID=UPI001CDD2F1C|nr:hypothetical protein [Deinococcus taeanensis]UBV42024.1 hypothetical protein LAJ19_10290 [Deinococcus taeanensis]